MGDADLWKQTVVAQWKVLAAVAYMVGSIPFGLVLVRWKTKQDVRQSGSGNIGATNVTRVAGRTLGGLTLALDALKGALPVLLARWAGLETFYVGIIGAAAFVGHCFPAYLRFRGGKGIATGFGIIAAMRPEAAAVALAAFGVVFAATRISSLATMSGLLCVGAAAVWTGTEPRLLGLLGLMIAIVIYKHVPNLRRLASGQEHRF